MRVAYLTGDLVHLRPFIEEDVDSATAWFDSPFPINASRAKKFLDDQPEFWWVQPEFTLIIARIEDDEVVGGLKLRTSNRRSVSLRFHLAPSAMDADALRADAIRIAVPWLRDEHEMMVVRLRVAADEAETIAAAESLGMQPNVRLREFVARGGTRVDEIVYEALNPRWEVKDA